MDDQSKTTLAVLEPNKYCHLLELFETSENLLLWAAGNFIPVFSSELENISLKVDQWVSLGIKIKISHLIFSSSLKSNDLKTFC